jgi:acyl transferase domain-containing protein
VGGPPFAAPASSSASSFTTTSTYSLPIGHCLAHTGTGTAMSLAANRISYAFDLHGPSLAVDTACSSSSSPSISPARPS